VQGTISLTWLIYNSYLPKLLGDFGFSKELAVNLIILENTLAIVMEPLFGGLSDRKQRWLGTRFPFITAGAIASSALFIAIPSIVTFFQPSVVSRSFLPILLVAWSFAMTIFRSPAIALLGRYAQVPELPLAVSLLTLTGGIVAAFKPVASKFILGFSPIFAFTLGSLVLLGACGVLRYVSPPPRPDLEIPLEAENTTIPIQSLAFIFATGCGIAWGSRLVTEIFSKTLQAQFRGESTDILMLWIGLVMAIAAIPAGIFAVKIGNAKAMIGGIVAIIPAMFLIVYVGINIGTLILAVAAYSLILNGVIPFALSSVSSRWSGLVIGIYFGGFSLAMALFPIVFPSLGEITPLGGAIGAALAFVMAAACIASIPKSS
jgi:hypothetical protein